MAKTQNMSFFTPSLLSSSEPIQMSFCIVNLSPVSEGCNPDIENREHGQSTMYSSDSPLAIEQVRSSLRLLEPMTKRENRFLS
eukprot:11842867-Ditylum_brightwellii.AAC.1